MKDILNIFEKGSFFVLDDFQFQECCFTEIRCAKVLRGYEWLDQK